MDFSEATKLLAGVDVVTTGPESAPVLALAHGAGGGVRENFAPFLADDRWRATGPYYPGAGGTPRTTTPLRLETLADQVVAAAVRAGGQRFAVLGMSLGTSVAVTAAIRHPEHVRALVLTVGFARPDAQITLISEIWRSLAPNIDQLSAHLLSAASSRATLQSLSSDEVRSARATVASSYPGGSLDHIDLVSRVDLTALLPQVRVPALVIAAGDDRIVLPSTSRALAQDIGGATLLEYPAAGHVFTEAENAQWAADVATFLDTW